MQKRETLCGIDDGKSKSLFVLNSRIVLLWSLYTAIQEFDKDLLALLDQVSDYHGSQQAQLSTTAATTGLGPRANEAARLLHLESTVAELRSLSGGAENNRTRTSLQLALMENVLAGYLDMRIAADRCQEELNYQYDVVLAQMTARRGKFLQKTYEANFIQTNTLGTTAGLNYLKGNARAGDELFIVGNSIGTMITTVSLLATQGGWRKNECGPNSLADFFDLRANTQHGFSELVWNFLNSPANDTSGKTRRDHLQEVWKSNAVTNMDIKKRTNVEKLASMPSCKWDTINLVNNRIALLSALREELGHFDVELLSLLRQAWSEPIVTMSTEVQLKESTGANTAIKLLGVQALVADSGNDQTNQHNKLLLTRSVLEGFLDANADADVLGREILIESQVRNRMIRQRDKAIQLTNILNFYQLGILGVISDSLGLSSNSGNVLAGNQVNIVSGFMVSCLAIIALLEQHGGWRTSKPEPNVLKNVFNVRSDSVNLSPLMAKYLDTTSPNTLAGLTRRQALIKYWQEAKICNANLKSTSTEEILSPEERAQHWWCETIKLIYNRICMLYDLRAVLRNSNSLFDELLSQIN
jgi:hypothetical protein